MPTEPSEIDSDPGIARLSPRTTPTWEMELLVSGATVFGLMQLPPVADRILFGLYNAASPDLAGLVLPLWIYVKFMLLTLVATFVAHLALRGYWVALAGLASVYPEGIRWDRLARRMGPLYLDISRRDIGELADAIERADNRASRVFGVGFGLAAMMLMPIALVLVMMALLSVYRLFGDAGSDLVSIVLVGFVLLVSVFGLVVWWDQRRGAVATADGLEGRALRTSLRLYSAIGLSRASNPLLVLFSSNEGTGRTMGILGGVMAVIFAIVTLQAVGDRLGWSMGDYAGLPPDRRAIADTVLPEHYASQRGDKPRLGPVPFIPDPVVRGDYLRLFVPYFPQRHNAAMERTCPDALADTGDIGPRARLDCLASIHAIAIDGIAQPIRFDAAEDARTGQRGMLAMIPVKALADGRHELTVLPPRRKRDDEPGAKPVTPYRIPFWR